MELLSGAKEKEMEMTLILLDNACGVDPFSQNETQTRKKLFPS